MNFTQLQLLTKQELNKLNNVNYYGSHEQILHENYIVNNSNIEMLYNESIQEYYNKCIIQLH